MNPIDIRDLSLHLDGLIAGMNTHMTRGPLCVTRNGDLEAVIIRGWSYAPKLHHFNSLPDGDLLCSQCGATVVNPNPYNLATALEVANEHWRTTHRQPGVDYRAQTAGLCREPHPAGWDRCHLPARHDLTAHRSTVGPWPAA